MSFNNTVNHLDYTASAISECMNMDSWWNNTTMVKSKYCPQRKTCPSVPLSTTNPTWIRLGFNPGPCSDKPVTNSLDHDMVLPLHVCWHVSFSNLSHALQTLFTSCKSHTRLRISWLAKEDHKTLRLSSRQSAEHYKYQDQTSSHLVLCIKKNTLAYI